MTSYLTGVLRSVTKYDKREGGLIVP